MSGCMGNRFVVSMKGKKILDITASNLYDLEISQSLPYTGKNLI